MIGFSIQFQGVANAGLLALLGVAIGLSLVVYGVWELIRGAHRRRGAVAVACGAAAAALVAVASARLPMDSPARRAAWGVLLAAVIVAAIAVFYSAVYAYLGRRRITTLLLLRFGAILALLLALFKPAISIAPSAEESKLVLAVLLDRSASMDTIDHADLPNRYRQAADALSAQRERMAEHFRIGWRHFAETAQSVADAEELASLSPTGASTDIAGAIRRVGADYGADELAGVILVTDGVHNAPGSAVDAARESTAPIYAIGVGSTDETAAGRRNVALLGVDAPLEAIRNNIATVTATVRLTGWANIPAKIRLLQGRRVLDAQQIFTDANAKTLTVQLRWTPGEPPEGLSEADIRKLTVAIDPNVAEATGDDNAAELHVLATEPSIRVLYVETARPEFKWLHRVLAKDPNVKLASLVRYQARKFRPVDKIAGHPLTDLPRTDKDLAFFDAMILGDLDRTFMTSEQMEAIRRFVADGKGLLAIGGRNALGPGGYGGTPVETALPVFCGSRLQEQETRHFVPQLTAAGETSPIFAGIGRFFHTPSRKADPRMPQLYGCVTVPRAKSGATVLAIHPTRRNADGTILVVLAVHRYGKGRAATFTADTTWRWHRLSAAGGDGPYHRFWGQMVRWLAGIDKVEKKRGASVLARVGKTHVRQGEDVKVTAFVRGADGQPAAGAVVAASLAGSDGAEPVTVPGQAAEEPGLYHATIPARDAGAYTLTITARDAKGRPLGRDSLPLRVAAHSGETDRLARDARTLQDIAGKTRGRYADLAGLPDVVDEIIRTHRRRLAPSAATVEYGVDSRTFPFLFILFVGLLTAEWLIRRNWQLQ